MKRNYIILVITLLLSATAFANNILVSNATISGQNTGTHTTKINFDVSWENSWRTSTNENNYDGAWIFVKYRKNNTTDWRHCTISGTGFTGATGSTITVAPDGKGIFIYRNADGIGNVNYVANQVEWAYGTDGILDNETVEIKVFALEMVYIPAGSFLLGSGGTETNAFKDGPSINPFLVTNGTITFGNTAGNLNAGGLIPASGTIPAAWPTGFNPFWIMKYECTQQQYVDFLNQLELLKVPANRTPIMFTGTHPDLVAPQPERAVGYLGFLRTAALADWSGLRPLTELEFEKACRGFNTPAVPNEYPWGNTVINNLFSVTNSGTANEAVNNPANANANYALSTGLLVPSRVGIFARSTGSDRTLSGGAYYGVMNMGDNLRELTVSVVNPEGLLFDGSVHGDGYLDATGNTDITIWSDNMAYGLRGTNFDAPATEARTSDRTNADYFTTQPVDDNLNTTGIRLARTAP
jgi:formylglycine-generating enzyme required for sulfatase activity